MILDTSDKLVPVDNVGMEIPLESQRPQSLHHDVAGVRCTTGKQLMNSQVSATPASRPTIAFQSLA